MEFDLIRMLVGEFSWSFTLEIVLRTTIMYLYTLALVRLLGKRTMGNLSPFEVVIIVALGSAVGDPMFYPDVPVVHGIVVITVVVGLQRLLQEVAERSSRVESLIESEVRCLIRNGVIDGKALDREDLAEKELFSALRDRGIENLGEVRLAFLEPTGAISVFRTDPAYVTIGRSILPDQ